MPALKPGLYVVVSMALLACTSAPSPNSAQNEAVLVAKGEVQEKYWQRALEHRAGGNLAKALEDLKIVDAINPEMAGLQAQISDLTLEIASRKSDYLVAAEWAFEQGDSEQGFKQMLNALALQPADDQLRRRVAARYRVIAESRISNRPETVAEPNKNTVPDEDTTPVANEVNVQKANDLFEQGLLVFDSDPDSAKVLFVKALEIDPTHVGARAYLDLL